MSMPAAPRAARAFALTSALGVSLLAAATFAQQGPIGTMFAEEQTRDGSLARSFVAVEQPATPAAAFPLKVYLSAGDLERAFDRAEFRPDAAIVPTNTELLLTAAAPATQRVLVQRIEKHPDVMRDLDEQVAARRKQSSAPSSGDPGPHRIGLDR